MPVAGGISILLSSEIDGFVKTEHMLTLLGARTFCLALIAIVATTGKANVVDGMEVELNSGAGGS